MEYTDELSTLEYKCPNEDDTYPAPSEYTYKNGKNKFAYVTLVMINDRYISAAIVLAQSIKFSGSKADLVVMITKDISEEGRNILRRFYDRVIEVPYVEIKNWRTKKQRHRLYLDLIFTKFYLFELTQYEKVIFTDADAIILKHPDHLFTLEPPAGCYLEDKNYFIYYDEKGNYVMPSNKKFEWYDKFCDCCGHGKIIPQKITDRLKDNVKLSGIGGGLWLMKPQEGEYESIIKDISENPMRDFISKKLIWPEQQYITIRYSGKWTSINPRFFGLQGYPHWKVLYGIQYGGDKPFMIDSKMDISLRQNFPDFILWHEIFRQLLIKHPDLKGSKVLDEAREMNKYFKKLDDESLEKLFEQKSRVIDQVYHTQTNLLRYITDTKISYTSIKIYNMLHNIKEFDFMEPVKLLANYHPSPNYYETIASKTFDALTDEEKETTLLEYTKCRSSIFIITLWPKAVKYSEAFIELLKTSGNVYYSKKIKINKKMLKNIMFWMYDSFTFGERTRFINKKINYVTSDIENEEMFIMPIIFDNIKNQNIAGQGSEFKTRLRNFFLKETADNLRGNDFIHINDTFYQTVEYAEMFLNENSLTLLREQNIDCITSPINDNSWLKFQTFRKWIFDNFSLLENTRIIILGSTIFYAFGIRSFGDIDAIMTRVHKSPREFDIEDTIINKNVNFLDIGLEGSSLWRESWTIKNNEVFKQAKINSSVDLVTNPKNYMYFMGCKLMIIEHEIVRKILRTNTNKMNRVKDNSDFIMLNFYNVNSVNKYIDFENGNITFKRLDIIPKQFDKVQENYVLSYLQSHYLEKDVEKITSTKFFKDFLSMCCYN